MLTIVRAAGKYPAMIESDRSTWQRAVDACRAALGLRGHEDGLRELQQATDEMRDQLERLRRESSPHLRTVRPTRVRPTR